MCTPCEFEEVSVGLYLVLVPRHWWYSYCGGFVGTYGEKAKREDSREF